MVKIKRKHLAALDAKKKQKPLVQHDVKSDPMVKACQALTPSTKKGRPQKLDSLLAKPSSTSQSSHQQKDGVKLEGEGDPVAEVSHTSASPHKVGHKVEKNEAPVASQNEGPTAPSSAYVQLHGDDSDTDSWVHVKKQRIIIIIPPLPTAKSRFLNTSQHVANLRKDGFHSAQRRKRAKCHEDKAKGNVSSTDMRGISARQDAIGTLQTENNTERPLSKHLREGIGKDAPPISSMDILLASALDTEHTVCTPWQKKTRQHICTYSEEEASLGITDSSAQPRQSSLKARKGLKVPLQSTKVAQGHIKKKRISLCKSAQPSKGKKHKQYTPAANDAHGHLLGPNIVDVKEKGSKYCSGDSLVLSLNQALKISTLKKHLEKAGGLRNWLCSIGLGQFKEAFEKKTWSERDLLELQMDDLKRMGKAAVGPRRKLIWAINYLSHQLV